MLGGGLVPCCTHWDTAAWKADSYEWKRAIDCNQKVTVAVAPLVPLVSVVKYDPGVSAGGCLSREGMPEKFLIDL